MSEITKGQLTIVGTEDVGFKSLSITEPPIERACL